MTGYNTKLAVSMSEIKKLIEQDNNTEALVAINNLWKVTCRLGKNEETISCSYLHSNEAVQEAETENRIIKGSSLYPHEIILKK